MFNKIKGQLKGFFDAKLNHEIYEEFSPLDQRYLDGHGGRWLKANDKIVVIDLMLQSSDKMSLGFAVFFLLVFILIGFNTEEGFDYPIIILLIIAIIVIVYYSYEIFKNRKGHIILDRENGTISFPVGLRTNKVYTSPFDKISVSWYGSGGSTGNLKMHLVANHPDKDGGLFLEGTDTDYQKIWSFYVWYMDKNRPLPPGKALDPYRQADFERRKTEGFPKPLYRSHIPTPEATLEHQAERDKYWHEQLEAFSREPESVMYDSAIHTNWTKVRYTYADEKPDANTYFRYELKNGTIAYMKTDENGSGHKPPVSEILKTEIMDLSGSWF